MNLSESDFQILRLSNLFYKVYARPEYKEIMLKQGRAYNCLLFQAHYNYFICIPYRSEITHDNAYLFRNSKRARKHKSGLDYSKIVIISNADYLETEDALIDKDEFNETIKNLNRIKREALKFVEDYVNHMNGKVKLHPADFKRRYQFTTLKYFHNKLGVNENNEINKTWKVT